MLVISRAIFQEAQPGGGVWRTRQKMPSKANTPPPILLHAFFLSSQHTNAWRVLAPRLVFFSHKLKLSWSYVSDHLVLSISIQPQIEAAHSLGHRLAGQLELFSTTQQVLPLASAVGHGAIIQASGALVPCATPSPSEPPSSPDLPRELLDDSSNNKHHRRRRLNSCATRQLCLCDARCKTRRPYPSSLLPFVTWAAPSSWLVAPLASYNKL